jgi:hypothetical protein
MMHTPATRSLVLTLQHPQPRGILFAPFGIFSGASAGPCHLTHLLNHHVMSQQVMSQHHLTKHKRPSITKIA